MSLRTAEQTKRDTDLINRLARAVEGDDVLTQPDIRDLLRLLLDRIYALERTS